MYKRITFYFLFCLLLLHNTSITAQQQLGQITINAGVGESPEFNGAIIWGYTPLYNVGDILDETVFIQTYRNGNQPYYQFTSITPNLGGAIDIGLPVGFSIGFAGSYQSVLVNWNPIEESNLLGGGNLTGSDKITRTNIALRLLYHFGTKKQSKRCDSYIGIRLGNSYWHDIPSATNTAPLLAPGQLTFLDNPNQSGTSFQVLYGMRINFHDESKLGLNFEIGIGSPYLAEGGLTFRFNTVKSKETSK